MSSNKKERLKESKPTISRNYPRQKSNPNISSKIPPPTYLNTQQPHGGLYNTQGSSRGGSPINMMYYTTEEARPGKSDSLSGLGTNDKVSDILKQNTSSLRYDLALKKL